MLWSCLVNYVALTISKDMTDRGFKWSCIVGSVVLIGSKDHTAFAFRVKLFKSLLFVCLTLKTKKNSNIHWNVRKYPLTQLRFPEDFIFSNTAEWTSDLALIKPFTCKLSVTNETINTLFNNLVSRSGRIKYVSRNSTGPYAVVTVTPTVLGLKQWGELLYEHQPRGTEPPQCVCQLPSNAGTKNSKTLNSATLISLLGDIECPHHIAGVQKHLTSGCLGEVRHSDILSWVILLVSCV